MAVSTDTTRPRVVGVGDGPWSFFRRLHPVPSFGRVTERAPLRRFSLPGGRTLTLSPREISCVLQAAEDGAGAEEAELRGLTGSDADDLSDRDSAELLEELRRRDDLFGTSLLRDARVAAGGPARIELRGDTVVADDCPVATLRAGAPAAVRRRFEALVTALERES